MGINRNQFIDNSKLNILYLISHPDDVSLSEVIQYDIVIVASKKKCQYFKKQGVRAYYLPQFTNPERFFYEQDSAFRTKILFVGNAYGGMRPAVDYATKNKLPISVFGKFWDKYLIDKKYIKGEYVDNNDLHKYYSNADIVLNDTNENMKLEGFVSNRIHDATACKSFVVSDYLPEIEKIYGDSIPMYRTEAEFCEIIKYYLSHPSERKAKAEKAYKITLKHYTNNVFAKKLDNIVSDYLLFKKPFSIFADYVLLPYNLLKLNRLKNLISPQLLDKLSQPVNVVDEEKIKKQKELVIDKILRLLMPVRIDLKNQGNSDNDLLVETDGKVSKPAYLTKNDGIGYVVEYTKLSNVIKLRIVHDGVLLIKFKSQDKRYKGNTYQFWIDYDSIKINDKEILSASVSSWHDKPYVYKLPVTNNQEIVIRVSIKYHNYSRDQILDILDKFSRESLKSLDLSDFIKLCEICGLNKS